MKSLLPWYILLLPLVSAVVITLVTHSSRVVSSYISVVAALVGFCCSCVVFAIHDISAPALTWLALPPLLSVPLGLVLDDLSKTMLLLVTGIGAVIHVYSLGYMRDD